VAPSKRDDVFQTMPNGTRTEMFRSGQLAALLKSLDCRKADAEHLGGFLSGHQGDALVLIAHVRKETAPCLLVMGRQLLHSFIERSFEHGSQSLAVRAEEGFLISE